MTFATALALAVGVAVTAAVATAAPLWTYALSLAAFGLPHVLVELRYVDERFGARIGRTAVWLGGGLLAVVVAIRVGAAAGVGSSELRIRGELLAGFGLAVLAAAGLGMRRGNGLAWAVAMVLAVGVLWSPLDTLAAFAVLHNVTPVAFLGERLRGRTRMLAMLGCAVAFGIVPVLIASGTAAELLHAVWPRTDSGPFGLGPLTAELPALVLPSLLGSERAPDLFAMAAYLQCLHYAVVLHVLPRLGGGSEVAGARWRWPRHGRLVVVGLGALMTIAFAGAFASARSGYAIAAALHAWLEIPVLLLACGMAARGAVGNGT
ncbi:MAG: hypothetical protein MUC36_01110 [Planctomycetes bacterium]|nr:hypothetical protein [Planctomycetota bacterium]